MSICKHVYLDALLCFCFQGFTVFYHVAFVVVAVLLTSVWSHCALWGLNLLKDCLTMQSSDKVQKPQMTRSLVTQYYLFSNWLEILWRVTISVVLEGLSSS